MEGWVMAQGDYGIGTLYGTDTTSKFSIGGQGLSSQWINTFYSNITVTEAPKMNKDQFAVLAEGTSSLSKTFDKLADAKAYAKQLTQQVKGRALVVKAVYAVTPKVDVEEEDL
jgi:hypothetical protein